MLEDTAVHMGQSDRVSDKQNIFKPSKQCILRSKIGEPLLKKVGLPPEIWQFWKEVALTVDKLLELWQRGQSSPWVPAQDLQVTAVNPHLIAKEDQGSGFHWTP